MGQGMAETGGTAWDKVRVKQSLFSHYVVFELFDFVDELIARLIKPYFVEVKATTAHSREDV